MKLINAENKKGLNKKRITIKGDNQLEDQWIIFSENLKSQTDGATRIHSIIFKTSPRINPITGKAIVIKINLATFMHLYMKTLV